MVCSCVWMVELEPDLLFLLHVKRIVVGFLDVLLQGSSASAAVTRI